MHFKFARNTIPGLLLSLVLTNTVVADQRHYPSAKQTPTVVGSEQFNENYTSLAGLEGVHVVTKYVLDSAEKYELNDMKSDLVEQIRQRLDSAGLRMLSEKEIESIPGQPTLSLFPAYSGNEIDAIKSKSSEDAEIPATKDSAAEHDCCRSSIWASFQQSASILRAPDKHYKFATWGIGEDTDDCKNRGVWTYDAVLKVVDKFTSDYIKAQRESGVATKPKLVSNAGEAPQSCDQAWLVNLNVFQTNQTNISDDVKPILNQLASTASRCKGYRYIIETHADQRSNSNYNRILSEARAYAIKDYLVSKNISYDRLETLAFGDSKPLTTGTTEQDHAVNRRVVIIPQLNGS